VASEAMGENVAGLHPAENIAEGGAVRPRCGP
jgi:hypothetical protein